MWWTARVGRDRRRRGGPPGAGADCAGCSNPARYDPLSGLPHIQAYRLSGDERRPQALWQRRPPVAEPRPEAMAVSSGLPARLPPAIGLPTRSRIEGDAKQAVDAGWRRWSPAQRQRCRDGRMQGEHHLVNRRAHLGARINRPRDLQGHRRREHLPATTSPRPATASAGAQPPTKGNQPGSQAASEQCHARRRHRLPGNRQTRGSMRLVPVTVRPALHASPPRGRGRCRRRLSASRPPPRPPAPVRTHSTGPTLQPPRGATPR